MLFRDGDFEKGKDQIKQAIECFPDNASAYSSMGNYYFLKGQFETAASWYQKALDIDSELEAAKTNLADAMQKLRTKPSKN